MNPARVRAYLMLTVVATIWGVATPVIKYTLEGFSSVIFLTYRFAISTILAIIIFSLSGLHFPKSIRLIFLTLLCGFLSSSVSLGLLFFGMENTTVLESSLITLASPLLISTAGVYFLHEHITKRERIGMVIAMTGTLLTIIEPLIYNGHSALKVNGNILVFGYVTTTVITAILTKKILREGVSASTLTNISFILGFLTFLPFALRQDPNLVQSIFKVAPIYHWGVLYMAALSGTLAYYLNNKAQKTIEIGEQSLFSYLYPVFAFPLAVIWLNEKITPTIMVGGVIIVIGVVIAELKRKRTLAEIKKKRYNS